MDGLRIDALRNFLHIIDEDDNGVASVGEVTNGFNALIIPAIQLHIANFPIQPLEEEQVRTWDANGDGIIDQHELGDMMIGCFYQLIRHQFPFFNALAFATLVRYVRFFNEFMEPHGAGVAAGDHLPVPPLHPVGAAPAPAPAAIDYMVCEICLNEMDDMQQVMKCNNNECNQWFHIYCIQDICNADREMMRICPNCRMEWPNNCNGFIRREGPVIGRPQYGGTAPHGRHSVCGRGRRRSPRHAHVR